MICPRLHTLELRPSRRLALIVVGAHLVVLLLLAALPVALWWQLGTAALLLFSAVQTISNHVLHRGRMSVLALKFTDRTQLRVRTRDGRWLTGTVLGTSTVGSALVVLNIRLDERRSPVHVVIFRDSMGRDEFRHLRVWLRWGPRSLADAAAVW